MGQVFRARDHRLQRDVALKVIPDELGSDPMKLRRFTREAQAASALNHPNIVTVHDFGETPIPYLVTELVQGRTLQELMTGVPFDEEKLRRIGGQLADGLAKAHGAGIVHRDLKPANVMLSDDGFVKILDFGLAKRVPTQVSGEKVPGEKVPGGAGDLPGDTVSLQTEAGMILGTLGYMSPEQAGGEALDFRSDQFSLGVILYEMATGQRAFDRPTPLATLTAIMVFTPDPVGSFNPDLSPSLVQLIDRLLEKSAEDRFESSLEVAEILKLPTREIDLTRPLQVSSPEGSRGGSASMLPADSPAAPAPSSPGRALSLLLGVLILLGAGLGLWRWTAERETERTVRQEGLPEINELLDRDEFVAAWLKIREVEQILGETPELVGMKKSSSVPVTLTSEPAGAEVSIQDYENPDGPWISLGTTPLEKVATPRDFLHWRFEKEGHEPAYRAIHSLFIEPKVELFESPRAPPDMVRVSAGSVDLGGSPVAFDGFWIDRFEVKNRDFQAFVDAGGYENPEYWTALGAVDFQATVARFLDKTGRPGPSTWELGSYPDGQADFPVQGVSWYEAAAYAEFVGKSLPSVHHWRHAAGLTRTMSANRLLLANIGRPEARLLETSGAMDPFGTFDMAGNVKEWCSNRSADARFNPGGSWTEPRYLFGEPSIQSPFERSETQGFRCVRYDAPPVPELIAPVESERFDLRRVEQPPDEVFDAYRSFYAYDPSELNVETVSVETPNRRWRKEVVTFDAAYGDERVTVHLFLPVNTPPPYQTVVFFPARFALTIPTSEDLDSTFADFLPRSGRALAYPIYKGTYERRRPTPSTGVQAQRDLIIQWSKDVQRTVDYLATRDDIDSEKLAFYGLSLGAIFGPIFTAIEDRFQVALQVAGGFQPVLMSLPAEANPVYFAPRSKIPTLMLNGRYDFNFPIETSVEPVYELFGAKPQDKELKILDSAHIPPRHEAFREILAWLDQYLGPV